MHWLVLIMAWVLGPLNDKGSHRELVDKEKWVLNEAIHLSDSHLADILQRRFNQGKDTRAIFTDNEEEMQRFEENFQKLQLLEYLENNSTSFLKKTDFASMYLEDFEDRLPNIMRGGLLDDWDFEIE
tara:strand:- start:71 stop:451 length:381 start_codon:yes stop_codon:yes gene_type:complete